MPRPSNFIADEAAAIRLGKALFWEMQVGSDGVTACATCHFHAGARSFTAIPKRRRAEGRLLRST
ncbi:MAG: cytochrome c peroxidase [Labilithrix sp.]